MKFNSVGFTLIELLVTVVITGILAALSVQYYDSYRQKAYTTVSLVAAQNAILAANVYLADDLELDFISKFGVRMPDQTEVVSGASSLSEVLPGFPTQPGGVYVEATIYGARTTTDSNKGRVFITAFHCKSLERKISDIGGETSSVSMRRSHIFDSLSGKMLTIPNPVPLTYCN